MFEKECAYSGYPIPKDSGTTYGCPGGGAVSFLAIMSADLLCNRSSQGRLDGQMQHGNS